MTLPTPYYRDDDNGIVLYCVDALSVLPGLSGATAIVTDPPYGIGYVGHLQNAIDYGKIENDDKPFDPTPILSFPFVVLWGANNYADRLPIGGWIVWDKRLSEAADKILGSPFELAWCSRRTLFKIVRVLHGGAKNADAPRGEVANQKRYHPTQKPVRVMQACCDLAPRNAVIVDPYVGSGSTLLACLRTGRRGIGIEISPEYCEIAADRLRREKERTVLFDRPAKREQRELEMAT